MILFWSCTTSAALVTDMPGSDTGMNMIVPSLRFGMNSEPMRTSGKAVRATTAAAMTRVNDFHRSATAISGRYRRRSIRLIGFLRSGCTLPRMNTTISAGTKVMESIAAAAIANVFVQASGWNSRPSWASSAKIGRNEMVTISRLKNKEGATSTAASIKIRVRAAAGSCSIRLCAFSIMTIAASTIAPMAMASPPRLIMFEPMSNTCMRPTAMSKPVGSTAIATSELRAWNRNNAHTTATMASSSSSVMDRVRIARVIRSARS